MASTLKLTLTKLKTVENTVGKAYNSLETLNSILGDFMTWGRYKVSPVLTLQWT